MIIVLKTGTPDVEVKRIAEEMQSQGLTSEKIVGTHNVVIGLVGDTQSLDPDQVQDVSPWIDKVLRVSKPFKRVSP